MNPLGYAEVGLFNKAYGAHRVIWAFHHGEWPLDFIDHINGIRNDNRLENLRVVPQSENLKNLRLSNKNLSGRTGVCWHKEFGRWHAQIKTGGVKKHLGYFVDFNDAVAARKKAEQQYGFHANHGKARAE